MEQKIMPTKNYADIPFKVRKAKKKVNVKTTKAAAAKSAQYKAGKMK
tara:strand:- start:12856 stop:12996 length:141 start_codon:yes stop_codon:yes gene_type:complete